MKHKSLSQLRDEDFAECLRNAARNAERNSRRVTRDEIIAEALVSRPRRYYLSFRTVESRLNAMRRAGSFRQKKRESVAQNRWADINSAVNRYLARNKKASVADAIAYVINFDRPARFYYSEVKARELFRRTLRCESRYVG